MRPIRRLSLGALALATAAAAMLATGAPADARSARQHKATHFTAQGTDYHHRTYRAYGAGAAGAYGAMPGGSGFSGPSYPGYGYGYGDNSHSYTN